MSKPTIPLITDIHLTKDNFEWVSKIVKQAIDKTVKLQLSNLIVAGDVFDERKSQPLSVLNVWSDMLDYAYINKIKIICIPGNHDKTNYESEKSYLDTYKYHPSMQLITSHHTDYNISPDWAIHFVPYFKESTTYKSYLDKISISDSRNNMLITHIAVNGVTNNDGSVVEKGIKVSDFDRFDKVFVGHYHNSQVINDHIIYVGSLYQANYGEDPGKGITVINNNGSYQRYQTQFTKYFTVKIDLDTTDDEELEKYCYQYANSKDNIRFKFIGQKHKVVALDKNRFDQIGIDVRCEYKDATVDVSFKQASEFSGFDSKKIKEEWNEFCENNADVDKNKGIKLLEKVL